MDRNIPAHLRRDPPLSAASWNFQRRPRPSTNWRGNGRQNGGANQHRLAGNFRARNTNFGPSRNNDNRFLRSTNESTDDEFINDLLNNENLQQVANSLSSTQRFVKMINSNLSDDLVVKLLKLVAQLCNSTVISNKDYIIKVTMQEKFVKRINLFLSLLAINDNKNAEFWKTFDATLNHITTILDYSLNLMPTSMWDHVKSVVKTIKIVVPTLKNERPVTIFASSDVKIASLEKDLDNLEDMFKKPENTENETTENQTDNEKIPDNNYRSMSIYPDVTELIIPDRPYVRKNIIDRPYASIAQYLDIHFRLLREDFVNSIRQDICDFLNKTNRRLFNIKIHQNVKFVERKLFKDTTCYEIQFKLPDFILKSLEKGELIKRFLNGTLLLFSHDNFNTMLSGKVVNSSDLKKGYVLVEIPWAVPNFDKNYLMIECVVFFEPYYQVLTVLKKLNGKSLPMEEYIIKVNKEPRPPKYMGDDERVIEVPGLNHSQESALNAAMSKEFVIIQGPPGTGKTFLGMKIVGEILKFKQHWQNQGPILIICFTNHALDQFLQGLKNETDKIARLGGQSNLLDIEQKYGPTAIVDELYADYFNKRREELDKNCSYYNLFIKSLKAGYTDISQYGLYNKIPNETKCWMEEKGRLNHIFYELKEQERYIKSYQKSISRLDTIKTDGIFKTVLIFMSNVVYYYFTDIDLACWLLCDDGSIKTNLNTVENVGLGPPSHINDELSKVYSLLCDCVNEREWKRPGIYFGLTIEMLKNYANELEEYLKINRHDRRLQDYIHFLNKKIDYLRMCLRTEFGPPEVDIGNINPWNLPSKDRWKLYNHWVQNIKEYRKQELEQDLESYQEYYNAYNILREEDNIKLLRKMDIIGMTTTCAAKMRSTLEALKNPIVVVEEAAEVLESHIVTALTENCQHLVLLGDHQQLKPTTSDHNIEKKFKLGISLFERMVNNNVQCHTLNIQHRMRPEISKLLTPTFYKDLKDSESVKSYPAVTGVKNPLFFIDHEEPEGPYGDSSKMNIHEAKFLIQLAIYLLNNGYNAEDITILAAYLGQTYILKEERNKSAHPLLKDVHITPIDNFQGEENKIILLSLVRSNIENNIGFLKVDNRVCVAISRAREGFYVMGNMTQLCASSEIWKPIKASLESQNAIGRYLTLGCCNHAEKVTLVSKSSDFKSVPEGGCNVDCNALLICGHQCKRKCHGYDLDHTRYVCMEPCQKSICDIPAHKCKKVCHDLCGNCYYPVERILPCGHKKTVQCSLELVKCEVLVEVEHDCKHIQLIPCYKNNLNILQCTVEVEKELACGHKNMIPCGTDPENFEDVVCEMKCEEILKCGHTCHFKCHKIEDPKHVKYTCLETCTKNKVGCHHPDTHPKCNLTCGEECEPCKVMILSSQNCSHFNKVECYKKQNFPCMKKCNKKLSCGHICPRECFEMCTNDCDQKTFKVIPECGHKIKVFCDETPFRNWCKQQCSKVLPCGHSCGKLCKEKCTQQCSERCSKVLDCGHSCIQLCHETCACKKEKYPDCSHLKAIKCGDILRKEDCQKECLKVLECGHRCWNECGKKCECIEFCPY